MGIPWDTIATILSVLISIGSLAYWLGKKFAEINERFRTIDERFRIIDERYKIFDERFKSINERFETINERFKTMEKRMNERFKMIDERFTRIENEIKRLRRDIALMTQSIQSCVIDFMSMKGIFTEKERDYLIREIRRLTEAYTYHTNPLKLEEAKFILEVLDEIEKKDPKEVDMRKVDKALEIIDRWLKEEITFEGFRMWILMYTLRSILRKERGEL